jgi:L-serine dehydratase
MPYLPEGQRPCSILNDVLGPIMRGPSSSHSAAPYAIATTCRQLTLSEGEALTGAVIRFDRDGSFARVHTQQGADEGFAAGLLDIDIGSPEYSNVLETLASPRPPFSFKIEVGSLARPCHPNLVELLLRCEGGAGVRTDRYLAVSTGGGTFQITACGKNPVSIDGTTHTLIVECDVPVSTEVLLPCAERADLVTVDPEGTDGPATWWLFRLHRELTSDERSRVSAVPGVTRLREAAPSQLPVVGAESLWGSAADVLFLCRDATLPDIAVRYESLLTGIPESRVHDLFEERSHALLALVETGLERDTEGIQFRFLKPAARRVLDSPTARALVGDPVHRAISGALAVMETTTARGVVYACPTAGSAGVLPGCLYSLKQSGHAPGDITDALKVAGIIGAIVGTRATFAAELAGCMVETGVAGAMAAAGLTYIAGGPPEAVFSAAATCLMNTLGLVCDPVGGEVEVPCHARNIGAVGHAFVASATAVGGFASVIPFDEVVDTLSEIGRCMPTELKCTSLGGLAVTPTARALSG